ncbi:hypothetical protein ACFOZ5_05285 [Marinobacter lacisalsi]|uniref:PEP-CTERM protein-sorting domain-containing protein n=1 Tax=Marinobacter lacisalsi TaxID=475979 RepID=A0ABV8QH79_9GAMM
MFRKFISALALITSSLAANAGLLHYDLNFESYDSEHSVKGTGFLLADTELNAVIGGQLASDEFVFSWSDASPQVLTRVGDYYGGDVVSAGLYNGVNENTGELGTLDLMFLLWPPVEGDAFADKLDHHFPEDIWSTIHVPSVLRGEGHWLNSPVDTHITLSEPVNMLYDVAGPSSFTLMVIGGLLIGMRRFRATA